MIYICKNCHFEFKRMSEVEQCPDCGKMAIQAASAQEAEAFRKRLQEDVWTPEKRQAESD